MEQITIRLANYMLHDKLQMLSAEYSLPVDSLINLAVKRLIDDIETLRELRTGKVDLRGH